MNKIFRFLYDLGLFEPLMFVTICLFLMGIMWNRHYIGFWFIRHTYTEKLVVVEEHFNNTIGGGRGTTGAVVFINERRVVFPLKKYVPKGGMVTIWYSPNGCETINALVKREGEQFIELQKRLIKNFLQFFMALNMPFLLLLYYLLKFIKEDKKGSK